MDIIWQVGGHVILSRAPATGDVRFWNSSTNPAGGFMTVVPMVFGSALCMIIFSLLTRPPSRATIDKYFSQNSNPPQAIQVSPTPASQSLRIQNQKSEMNPDAASIKTAQEKLDAHVREIVQWHFSPETGSPFWLDWTKKAGWNPATDAENLSPTFCAFRISRMNGCAICRMKFGRQKNIKAVRSTFLKPAARPACPNSESAGMITRWITASFPRNFPTRIFRAIITG